MADVLPYPTCPLCGKPNDCAAVATGRHDVDCWCTKVTFSPEALAQVPAAQRHKACLCRACAVNPPPSGNEPA